MTHLILLSRIFIVLCMAVLAAPSYGDPNRSLGKVVYKKANCIGCHKWHGGGGGGYGGLALSLRETQLDRDTLIFVIRCGRPGTRMPYHVSQAYQGDNRDCYETTRAELDDATPPRARYFLRDREIAAVVDYVQSDIQGRGTAGYDDCVAFWGVEATRCKHMALQISNQEKK